MPIISYIDKLNKENSKQVAFKNTETLTIGNDNKATINLESLKISGILVKIYCKNNKFYLEDTGICGTYLNEEYFLFNEKSEIKDGDCFELEGCSIKFYFFLKEHFAELKTQAINKNTLHQKSCHTLQSSAKSIFLNSKTIISRHKEDKNLQKLKTVIEKLEFMFDAIKEINAQKTLNDILITIIQKLIEFMKADSGCILLKSDTTGRLLPFVSVKPGKQPATIETRKATDLSMGIALKTFIKSEPMLINDTLNTESLKNNQSIFALNIRSAVCIPLINRGIKIGVLYIDSRSHKNLYTEEDIPFLEALGEQIAVIIENARLQRKLIKTEKIRSNLERYLSKDVINKIILNPDILKLGGKKMKVTILFTDIRNFTPLSEKMEPEKLVSLLNKYFSTMIDIIFKFGGTLDKFIGDSIMALFGAPFPQNDSALNAIKAAIKMQSIMEEFNSSLKNESFPEIEMGIGINTGMVVAGNIGSIRRMEYTVIGDAVNLAHRIQSIAKGGEILISESTFNELKGKIKAQQMKDVKVKGFSQSLNVYKLIM